MGASTKLCLICENHFRAIFCGSGTLELGHLPNVPEPVPEVWPCIRQCKAALRPKGHPSGRSPILPPSLRGHPAKLRRPCSPLGMALRACYVLHGKELGSQALGGHDTLCL